MQTYLLEFAQIIIYEKYDFKCNITWWTSIQVKFKAFYEFAINFYTMNLYEYLIESSTSPPLSIYVGHHFKFTISIFS